MKAWENEWIMLDTKTFSLQRKLVDVESPACFSRGPEPISRARALVQFWCFGLELRLTAPEEATEEITEEAVCSPRKLLASANKQVAS